MGSGGCSSVFSLSQDEGFTQYLITNYCQADLASARRWIESNDQLYRQTRLGKWAAWETESASLVGMGGLTPWEWEGESLVDITYRLRKSAWGKGLGSELAKALLDHGLHQLKLTNLSATITPDNLPSKKIIERLGFKRDCQIKIYNTWSELYRWPVS